MKSIHFVRSAFVLGLFLIAVDASFGQAPATLKLTAKLRDFNEQPNGRAPADPGRHPDFNTSTGCSGKGYIQPFIDTTGQLDTANFPNDNRNPTLIKAVNNCYAGVTEFNQWYNDKDNTINRPFLHDLLFTPVTGQPGMYQFVDSTFFPLDNALIPGTTRPIPGHPTTSFGQNSDNNTNHNFGFTMEFHAKFTYFAQTPTRAAQKFNFKGDDDVWVFVNGKLAIDLGGVHGALTDAITFDAATAASFGLLDGQSYFLDFFFAERHVTQSNCIITTSLQLETQKLPIPVPSPGNPNPPGYPFNSSVSVTLKDDIADTKIYYTLDGKTPDSTSTLYTGPLSIIATDTLKAIAYKVGWAKSDVMTAYYSKNFVPSTLDILDGSGLTLQGGYLTEANTSYLVKVVTSQAGLNSLTTPATTKVSLDQESLTLLPAAPENGNLVFTGTSPFSITTATVNNGKTEASNYDSLIVTWTNPNDPKDVAQKRVLVRPKGIGATAYFSTKADGSDNVQQFVGTETTIYLIVVDQILPTGSSPTVTLTTVPGPGRTVDTETFSLTVITPGKYSAAIPVDINGASTANDHKLALAVADQILGKYKDPVDLFDSTSADAGFGVAPEITPTLSFTDKDGNALPNGFYYSPANGFLYLTYKDDWVNGSIATKTVTLSITNNKGLAAGDAEVTFTLTYDASKKSGSTGTWTGSFPLKDILPIVKNDNIAETYVLGDVIASLTSHNKTGGAQGIITDELLVAYGNQDPVIGIEGPNGPGLAVGRDDQGVKITIKDQSLSSQRDTLYATLSCTESKDVVVNVMLIEKADKPGEYESVIISKSEGATVVDGTLQCQSRDFVKVSYKDPVYGDVKEVQVPIDKQVTTKLYYSSKSDGSDEITSVSELDAQSFYVVLLARSPNVSAVDSFQVTFTTAQGETKSFWAVETGPYTEKFIAKVPYAFVTGALDPSDKAIEARITAKEINNYVTATGTVTVENQTAKAPIDLVAGFDPIDNVYIKDTDGNGRGDKVYLVFEKKLARLPTTVGAQWNDAAAASQTATGPKLTFLNSDSLVVVADYTANEFPAGLTARVETSLPRATLPNDALFKGQNPDIKDSIGPILLTAIKRPGKANPLVANDPSFNLDTLIVTLSEPLKTADFHNVLKFATSCDDYNNAKTITAYNNPVATDGKPNEYVVIVDNSTGVAPQTGNCVFLNADPGLYTDNQTNPPPKYGVVLTGDDRNRIIQVFRGFPPVAGLDPNNDRFQVSVQDSRDPVKQGYATPDALNPGKYEVIWIPPAGFDANNPSDFDPYKVTLNDLPSGSRETATPVKLPTNISAIQVVSTTAYIAHISIFDIYGNFVRSTTQAFGGHGELQNLARVVPKGLVSFLVWDMKDKNGQLAGQGVYVWKVSFEFKGGKQEVQYTRTGVLRVN